MNNCATLIRRGGVRSSLSRKRAFAEKLAAGLLVLFLAACGGAAGIDRSSVRERAPADQAFVFPPVGGPAIVDVIQGRRSGGIYQEILLATDAATPGQNRIQVTVYENTAPLVDPYPRIAAEMRAALPGVRMARSPYFVQNRYGPFGYAFGRGAGRDLCMFGWQSIRSRATPMTRQGGIDIRARICAAGASERDLLAFMYGYTIGAFLDSPRWNPYGDPLPPAAELGRRGANIYPEAAGRLATATSPLPAAKAAPRGVNRTVSLQPAAVSAPPAPIPTAPPVPSPPGATVAGPTVPAQQAPPVPLPPAEPQ